MGLWLCQRNAVLQAASATPTQLADVERDQMQAKMPLYTHISAYIQVINNK